MKQQKFLLHSEGKKQHELGFLQLRGKWAFNSIKDGPAKCEWEGIRDGAGLSNTEPLWAARS